ncbi:YihY family inner membrane protein [Snodgrassella gandavensis]|uniref:YihY family inner membrane protein n=1 Tax=Snodgrassella gandavensis TaxID=2946698 RepID=UPI001EF6B576|nr:YihY family inner membrane protein [Snodgrassella gandavensis]
MDIHSFKSKYLQQRLPQFLLFVGQNYQRCNLPLIAASLTFTTLLALVPFFTITVIVVNAFPMFADMATRFNQFLTHIIVPAAGADSVSDYLYAFRDKASGLTAVGISFMIITSLMLIQTIEHAFNQIWQARDQRPLWIRILIYWALLTLGPVVLGMSLSAIGLLSNPANMASQIPFYSTLFGIVTNLALITLLLFLIYKLVPFCFVRWHHALLGAIITAVGLDLLRRGFAIFVTDFGNYQKVYGAFAAIPVFLIWLNLLWLLLLAGAVLTSSLPYWHQERFRYLHQCQPFENALDMLYQLLQAQQQGQAVKSGQLQQQLSINDKHLDQILTQLEQQHYIAHSSNGWLLQTDPDKIMLADLYKLFIYQPNHNSAVGSSIQSLLQPCLQQLDISLCEWAKQLPQQLSSQQPQNKA